MSTAHKPGLVLFYKKKENGDIKLWFKKLEDGESDVLTISFESATDRDLMLESLEHRMPQNCVKQFETNSSVSFTRDYLERCGIRLLDYGAICQRYGMKWEEDNKHDVIRFIRDEPKAEKDREIVDKLVKISYCIPYREDRADVAHGQIREVIGEVGRLQVENKELRNQIDAFKLKLDTLEHENTILRNSLLYRQEIETHERYDTFAFEIGKKIDAAIKHMEGPGAIKGRSVRIPIYSRSQGRYDLTINRGSVVTLQGMKRIR